MQAVPSEVAGGLGATSTIISDSFLYGKLESEGDHDWYRLELDVGRYVITLNGSGLTPVGDTLLVLRDSAGVAIRSNDSFYSDAGESRLDVTISAGQTVYLDVSGLGPFVVPDGALGLPGTVIGASVGDYALTVNRITDSLLESMDWGTRLPTSSVDVYFAESGETGPILYGAFTQLSKGWNAYEARQALAALEEFSAVCDVTFRRTFDRAGAEFTLLLGGRADAGGGGFFASPGTIGEGTGVFGGGALAIANDKWADAAGGALEKGGNAWQLLVHEFGHGLGLAHPHDTGGASVIMNGVASSDDAGDYGLNSEIFTIMTYRGGGSGPDGRSPSGEYGYMAGPMAFDIALLQGKYGANTTAHAGNDVYLLPGVNELGTFYSCIWDTAGIDTISAASASDDCIINLNDATLRYEPGGGGFVSSVRGNLGRLHDCQRGRIGKCDGRFACRHPDRKREEQHSGRPRWRRSHFRRGR